MPAPSKKFADDHGFVRTEPVERLPSQLREDGGDVIAVCCSDLHASARPPDARSAEPDWMSAQRRVLKRVREEVDRWKVPLILAGDVFHSWNQPASVINLLLRWLPDDSHGIPGQHDLRYHNLEDIKATAYWTLVAAGKVRHLAHGEPSCLGGLTLHGFPWGTEVTPLTQGHDLTVDVAVVHAYCWRDGSSHPRAEKGDNVSTWRKRLKGFDCAVFGDNHKGFLDRKDGGIPIMNCGCLQRRSTDERDCKPAVGLIHSDGTMRRVELDSRKDRFIDNAEDLAAEPDGPELKAFVRELDRLTDGDVSFEDAVRKALKKIKASRSVERIVLTAMEEGK